MHRRPYAFSTAKESPTRRHSSLVAQRGIQTDHRNLPTRQHSSGVGGIICFHLAIKHAPCHSEKLYARDETVTTSGRVLQHLLREHRPALRRRLSMPPVDQENALCFVRCTPRGVHGWQGVQSAPCQPQLRSRPASGLHVVPRRPWHHSSSSTMCSSSMQASIARRPKSKRSSRSLPSNCLVYGSESRTPRSANKST